MKSAVLLYIVLIKVFRLIRSSTTCGGNVNGSIGLIKIPKSGNSYNHNLNCTWTVTGKPGSVFTLTFEKFNIICSGDTVTIYDGEQISNTTLLDKACGISKVHDIGTLKSTSNVLTVEFISDAANRSTGFHLTWNETKISQTNGTTPQSENGKGSIVTYPVVTTSLTEGSGGGSKPTDTQIINRISTGHPALTTDIVTTGAQAGSSSSSSMFNTSKGMTSEIRTRSNELSQTTETAVPVIAGATGGASVSAIIIIVIVCCLRRSKPTKQKVQREGLAVNTIVNTGVEKLCLRDMDKGSNTIIKSPSYTDITEESIINMKNMKANINRNEQGEVNEENSEINPYNTTSECIIVGLDSNGTSAPGVRTMLSDVKVEIDMNEKVPALNIYAIPHKNHTKGKSDIENSNHQNMNQNTENPNLNMPRQITDIYAVPHKNREDIYQETLEGEYDVLHQKRQKTTSGDSIYDVSQPDEGDYSDARLVKKLKDDDTYDHTNIQEDHDVTYDTADNVLSE